MKKNKIAAVILAAGDSHRMGQPKALLNIKGKTFLETILNNLAAANFNPLILMLGNHYEQIKDNLTNNDRVIFIKNPNPENGQLSSLQIAIRSLPSECTGLVQSLVDHPLVKLSTYKKIYEHARKFENKIIIPKYKNKRGHPVYFGKIFFTDLLDAPLSRGARHVVMNNADNVDLLEVDDKGVNIDIDTPEEYNTYI